MSIIPSVGYASVVTLECAVAGSQFLDGRTGNGTVGTAPHTGIPFSGTRWEAMPDGAGIVTLKCLGDVAGPRYLDGRTNDGSVALVDRTTPPYSGTRWQVVQVATN